MDRTEARKQIREAAGLQRMHTNLKMSGIIRRGKRRQAELQPLPKLQQAVRICRQYNLVDDEVLIAAGFNPSRS